MTLKGDSFLKWEDRAEKWLQKESEIVKVYMQKLHIETAGRQWGVFLNDFSSPGKVVNRAAAVSVAEMSVSSRKSLDGYGHAVLF